MCMLGQPVPLKLPVCGLAPRGCSLGQAGRAAPASSGAPTRRSSATPPPPTASARRAIPRLSSKVISSLTVPHQFVKMAEVGCIVLWRFCNFLRTRQRLLAAKSSESIYQLERSFPDWTLQELTTESTGKYAIKCPVIHCIAIHSKYR